MEFAKKDGNTLVIATA
ncbi:hypothetical protein ACLB1O_17050 [Escherichia coli]